jgi:uncharacterized protein (TIGR03435 family)
LKDYIGLAYSLTRGQVFGPDWIGSERYDIQATIPAGTSRDQLPEMFQSLLVERFEMKLHREKREFPVYALTLGKGPLKTKQSSPDEAGAPPAPVTGVALGSGGQRQQRQSWQWILVVLCAQLVRSAQADDGGICQLSGTFRRSDALENSSSASLSDALETAGLKPEPRKAPLDVLVVDSARKTPTENRYPT